MCLPATVVSKALPLLPIEIEPPQTTNPLTPAPLLDLPRRHPVQLAQVEPRLEVLEVNKGRATLCSVLRPQKRLSRPVFGYNTCSSASLFVLFRLSFSFSSAVRFLSASFLAFSTSFFAFSASFLPSPRPFWPFRRHWRLYRPFFLGPFSLVLLGHFLIFGGIFFLHKAFPFGGVVHRRVVGWAEYRVGGRIGGRGGGGSAWR